jgi:hypothetical protein
MKKYKIVKREFSRNHKRDIFNDYKWTNTTIIAEFNVDSEEYMNVIDFFNNLIPHSQQIYDTGKSRAESFVGYWLYDSEDNSLHAIYKEVA